MTYWKEDVELYLLSINSTTLKLAALYFCSISFVICIRPAAQTLRQPISSVYTGLGAYSTEHLDVFSFVNNQAALAQIKGSSAGVYGERRFLLNETSQYTAAVAVPSSLGNFGLSIKYFGFQNYNESQLGFAYARSLGKKMDIGVQFNYYGYRVPAYNSDNTVNVEIGAIVHVTDKLNAGVHVYSPVGGQFSKTDEKLSSAYTIGLGYDASERFFISAELEKQEAAPVNLNAGFQYRFAKQFFTRAGIASATSTFYAGFGVGWNIFRLDLSGSYHPQLGLSPGLLLIIDLQKKEAPSSLPDN
jgi:hypothetical protein